MHVSRYLQLFAERRPGVIGTIVGAVLLVAITSGLRVVLGAVFGERACFALYFPAILAGALLLGWRTGLLVAILSAVAADYLPIGPPMSMGMVRGGLLPATEYWFSAFLIIATAEILRRTLVRLKAATETERALNQELRHRVNNSLALALAFASQTKRSAPEPAVFFAAFQSRLQALARAHDILSSESLGDCRLPRLAESALEAFAQRNAITLSGDPCSVPSVSCVPLVLALHELTTNAVKHGALSAPGGTVAVSWTIRDEDAGPAVVLQWVEHGGPPVEHPTRKGLGSRLLVRQAGLDEVKVKYPASGLQCTMVVGRASTPRATPGVRKPRLVAVSA